MVQGVKHQLQALEIILKTNSLTKNLMLMSRKIILYTFLALFTFSALSSPKWSVRIIFIEFKCLWSLIGSITLIKCFCPNIYFTINHIAYLRACTLRSLTSFGLIVVKFYSTFTVLNLDILIILILIIICIL